MDIDDLDKNDFCTLKWTFKKGVGEKVETKCLTPLWFVLLQWFFSRIQDVVYRLVANANLSGTGRPGVLRFMGLQRVGHD